jgi:fatty-acyl-CoA synthase
LKTTRLIPRTPSAYGYPLLIKQLLHTPILYAPDQEIVYRDRIRHSYRELYARICRLASALARLGIGPGDTVAVLDWDSHRYLECFYAVPMLGAILHTVNVRLSPEQIMRTMGHAGDDLVLINRDFVPLLEGKIDRLKTVKGYVLLQDGPQGQEPPFPIAAEYERMLTEVDEHPAFPDLDAFPDFDEDTQATIFYTTGTTGDPKGVYFSHRQLVIHTMAHAMALSCFRESPLRSGDVYMPLTPMFHVHAWGIPYVAALLGVKQVYPGRYLPEVLLRLIEREKVTFSHCVPTILRMILDHPLARQIDLSNWTVNIGGSALSRGLAEEASQLGIRIFAGYGLSETCPILTVANLKPHMLDWPLERRLEVARKTGTPVPLVNMKLIDVRGAAVPADGRAQGEVVVRAPWLTQGYYRNPDASEQLWHDSWLHTGDIATMDEEGYIQIRDRLKDVIKSGGEWISSLELESLLSQHPAVAEAAVVGVPDEKWGERPRALIVLKPESAAYFREQDLRDFLQERVRDGVLSKWAIPDRIDITDAIPKTSVGKIDKRALRGRS